jgi:ribonuclease Z
MDMSVLFLGTAGSVPTAQRGLAGSLVRHGGDRILIDCGEGTQRQLLRSGVGLVDIQDVFITHHHADHFLGLPGMLKTFSLRSREAPLHLHGPAGVGDTVRSLARVIGRLSYPLELTELRPGDVVRRDGYRVEAFATDHGVPSLGYGIYEDLRPGRFDVDAARALGVPEGPLFGALQRGETVTLPGGELLAADRVVGPNRAGRRLVFSGDTRPCAGVLEAAAGADLLVHEATFLDEEAARAAETGHSTARQAGRLAREAAVHMLALVHLSTRYAPHDIRAEAEAEFDRVVVPRDFDQIELPLPERGLPVHLRAPDGRTAAAAPDPAQA